MDVTTGWMFLTRWGNSLLLLPTALCICIGLWTAGRHRLAARWAGWFGGAVLLVLATKLAFLGWGIGIRSLDFTGVSGHSTLASSVLPMLAWWLTQDRSRATQRRAVVGGVALALVVAVSRVLLSTHSVSEVVAGVALGLLVARAVIPHDDDTERGALRPRLPLAFRWAVLAVLLVAGILPGLGDSDEAHGFVTQLAVRLSGRTEPFSREML